ncbi:MAG: sodium-translocating pyrophosphatase [Candidatus Nealsonbacteria bacterium]
MHMLYIPIIVSLLALVFTFFLTRSISKVPQGTGKIVEVARAIREGAAAFLRREFKVMLIIFALVALALGIITGNFFESLTFLVGAGISCLAGFFGMMVSTRANSRTANMAKTSFPKSFKVAFLGGEVMGFLVVGLGLLGVTVIWLLFKDTNLLISYAFGSSLVALFLRVGGGIYTKSADVGADLVGKVERDIPEDDPRNPAVIADNVGDNVGDIAGMGSDLFESYVSAIIAAMVIGVVTFGTKGLFLPLILASAGILSSILGSFFVRLPNNLEKANFEKQTSEIRKAMEKGVIVANILMVVAALLIVWRGFNDLSLFYALLVGLAVGFLIGKVTEYYTSENKKPVQTIAKSAQSGASPVIIEGFATGIQSSIIPAFGIAIATILAYYFGGLYGIAIASVGILGVLGINLSSDCYGPIADNAAGISEMAGLPPEARQKTEALDAVGNTTAATGKGFAIGSAALAALAWLAVFFQVAKIEVVSISDPNVIAGLFIGAALSFWFCALTMKAVGKGALEVVKEVRRQFKEIPGLAKGKGKADYGRCVDLITKRALKEMIVPGVLVVLVPVLIGIILGVEALAGLLAGALVTGFLLALTMANSGGAWDNAKKYIEAGNFGGKGSEAHKAAVVGDTVGDPFKDTSGPSLNILIKLLGKVALLFLPLFI